jgi:hypothetical protein
MLAVAVAGVATLLAAAPLVAHHAFSAEFDANQPIVLKGTVSKTEWINPHAWVYIDVTGPDGRVENWAIECGAPNALLRRGWSKNSLPIGVEIVVDGFRAKDGSTTANARDITTPDGRKVFVGSSGTGAPYEERGR